MLIFPIMRDTKISAKKKMDIKTKKISVLSYPFL